MKGILIDDNGNFMLTGGSVSIGDVDEQIVEIVMVAAPGEIKEMPTIGMNLNKKLNGIFDPFFVGKLKTQLKTQHITAKSIVINTEEINVEL